MMTFARVAILMIMTMTDTSSFVATATAAAAAPNGNDNYDVTVRLRGRSTGDSAGITLSKDEQHPLIVSIQNEEDNSISSVIACTTSCSQGKTCTPGSDRCSRLLSQVCGCDDKTYSNTCEAFRAGVNVAHSGGCGKDNDNSIIMEQEVVSSLSSLN